MYTVLLLILVRTQITISSAEK